MKNLASILSFLFALCVWFGGLYLTTEIVINAFQGMMDSPAPVTGAVELFIVALIGIVLLEKGARFVFSLRPNLKGVEA